MNHVTVFLRTALFSLGGPDAHVPAGAMVLKGQTSFDGKGSVVRIDITDFLDHKGQPLKGSKTTLTLPMSKIDHLLHHEA